MPNCGGVTELHGPFQAMGRGQPSLYAALRHAGDDAGDANKVEAEVEAKVKFAVEAEAKDKTEIGVKNNLQLRL